MNADYSHRHVGTQHAMRLLVPNYSLDGTAQEISEQAWVTAQKAVALLEDGPELSAGLRKLLEAKDCLVRQALLSEGVI